MIFAPTPSQTVGPFFSIGLPPVSAARGDQADTIRITGTVYDGRGEPVPDSVIETWQADSEGRFADLHGHGEVSRIDGFSGFARFATENGDGRYEIVTLKPGPVAGPGGSTQAPHIDVSVMARGMLHRCVTRIYFADEAEANAADAVLNSVPAERRETLLARPVAGGYEFDVFLQGERETVFFAV